jgi:MFS family permease
MTPSITTSWPIGSRGRSGTNTSSAHSIRRQITKQECREAIASSWSPTRKWMILSVVFMIQISMNFNASVYSNAVPLLMNKYNISENMARYGQVAFLLAYGFGCELWAPWSEEYGRFVTLQLSLGFVNIWQIICALSPTFGGVMMGRILGGFSSAGGSVTLAIVADMWNVDTQQFAVAFIVFSSVSGSVIGPIFGAFIQEYLSLQWNFWIQFLFGLAVQTLHFFLVPETRETIILDREAKKLREQGHDTYGPNEMREGPRVTLKSAMALWIRPFHMFATEPIVLLLSLLSGFSDALIFSFLETFSPVYRQWNFDTIQIGLSFIP